MQIVVFDINSSLITTRISIIAIDNVLMNFDDIEISCIDSLLEKCEISFLPQTFSALNKSLYIIIQCIIDGM